MWRVLYKRPPAPRGWEARMRVAGIVMALVATAAAVACSGGGGSVTRPTASQHGFGSGALSEGAPGPAARRISVFRDIGRRPERAACVS